MIRHLQVGGSVIAPDRMKPLLPLISRDNLFSFFPFVDYCGDVIILDDMDDSVNQLFILHCDDVDVLPQFMPSVSFVYWFIKIVKNGTNFYWW